jgi:hypothetical protein
MAESQKAVLTGSKESAEEGKQEEDGIDLGFLIENNIIRKTPKMNAAAIAKAQKMAKLEKIAGTVWDLGGKIRPDNYNAYMAAFLHVHFGFKIEYGVILFEHKKNDICIKYRRGHIWNEMEDGSICDMAPFLETGRVNREGRDVFYVKQPVIGGVQMKFEAPADNKYAGYTAIEGRVLYFKDGEIINLAIEDGQINIADFTELGEIFVEGTDVVSQKKVKQYVRTKQIVLAAALKKYCGL